MERNITMKVFNSLMIGLGFGFVFTVLFMVMFTGFDEVTSQLLAWCIASAVFGISALVFESQKLKLIQQASIHFTICLLVTITNGFIFYREYLVIVAITFTITYIIIFVISWLLDKQRLKSINEKLSKNI